MPFIPAIRALLCDESGSLCAAPFCRTSTGRPDSQSPWTRNGGDGCHIFGEKPGSARYGPTDPAFLASAENGIWLCPTCHRRIDRFEHLYRAPLLQEWKREALARHLAECLQPRLPNGSASTGEELHIAYAFLDTHREAVEGLNWLLHATARQPFAHYVEVPSNIVNAVTRASRTQINNPWTNLSADWCFGRELQDRQQELMRLARMIKDAEPFKTFPAYTAISLEVVSGREGEPVYVDPTAAMFEAYISFFRWFEDSLGQVRYA